MLHYTPYVGVVLDVPNPNIGGGCSCLLVTVSINFVDALLSEYYFGIHCRVQAS